MSLKLWHWHHIYSQKYPRRTLGRSYVHAAQSRWETTWHSCLCQLICKAGGRVTLEESMLCHFSYLAQNMMPKLLFEVQLDNILDIWMTLSWRHISSVHLIMLHLWLPKVSIGWNSNSKINICSFHVSSASTTISTVIMSSTAFSKSKRTQCFREAAEQMSHDN